MYMELIVGIKLMSKHQHYSTYHPALLYYWLLNGRCKWYNCNNTLVLHLNRWGRSSHICVRDFVRHYSKMPERHLANIVAYIGTLSIRSIPLLIPRRHSMSDRYQALTSTNPTWQCRFGIGNTMSCWYSSQYGSDFDTMEFGCLNNVSHSVPDRYLIFTSAKSKWILIDIDLKRFSSLGDGYPSQKLHQKCNHLYLKSKYVSFHSEMSDNPFDVSVMLTLITLLRPFDSAPHKIWECFFYEYRSCVLT